MPHRTQSSSLCPVESGEECLVPDRRKWSTEYTLNLPSLIAILGLAVAITGALI